MTEIQHEAIAKIQELASELGQTPSREQFVEKHGRYIINISFENYTALCLAANLEPRQRTYKPASDIFKRTIEPMVEAHEPRARSQPEAFKRCIFIPDTHFPFVHKPTLDAVYKFAEAHKPEIIVQLGDLFDMYSFAKFPRSHNQFTPREEYNLARKQAEEMWRTLVSISPNSTRYQIAGNHDLRPLKRILEVAPEFEDWAIKMFKDMMTFEGVETVTDSRQELFLPGDVMVLHGHFSKLGDLRDANLMNAVCGHQHVGGVVFRNIKGRTLFELNCGLAGDPTAKGLTYTPQKMNKWTLGFGWLDEYGPRFIAL